MDEDDKVAELSAKTVWFKESKDLISAKWRENSCRESSIWNLYKLKI